MSVMSTLLFVIAFFECAVSVALLRAGRDRYDNRVFAAMGFLEGSLEACRGILLLAGADLFGEASLCADLGVNILLGFFSICFAYSFPFNRKPPLRLMVPLGLFALGAMTLSLHPATLEWSRAHDRITYIYFLPVCITIVGLMLRNYMRLSRPDPLGIPLIMLAMAFRWGFAMFTFTVGRTLSESAFRSLVDVNITGVVLAGQIVMGYAIFKSQLFRLRGIATSFLVWVCLGSGILGLLAYSVDFIHKNMGGPSPSRALLILVAILPVGLLGIGVWLRPWLYRAIVCPLDPRRALRQGVIERVLGRTARQVDPAEVLDVIRDGLRDMGTGRVRFLRGPDHPTPDEPTPSEGRQHSELSAVLAEHLRVTEESHLHRHGIDLLPPEVAQSLQAMPGDLLVPVRRDRSLYGVLVIEGGEIDRDTLLTAVVSADHLAHKIDSFGLFAEHLRTSQKLADTQAFLENLFDSLPVGVAVLSVDSKVVEWNRAQEAATGISRADALGRGYFTDLFPGLLEAGVDDMVRDLCKDGGFKRVERHDIEYTMPGRAVRVTDAIAAPFRDRDGSLAGVVVIATDVTERKRLETELAESRRLASLGAFAAAIAHEIRTPLTSVQMNVQILRSKVDLPPDDMEYFDIAQEELRRLNAHVAEILDYAKPLQLHAIPSDLREIADDTLRGLEPILKDRKVRVEREHARDLPAVAVDAQRIRQVLVNLMDNAANASAEGSAIVLRTRAADDGRVTLEVADHGKGIRSEDLPKIFEPFFTTRADGTGLGLAIAQKIVRAHGAELLVESIPGEGATFTVVFGAPRAA